MGGGSLSWTNYSLFIANLSLFLAPFFLSNIAILISLEVPETFGTFSLGGFFCLTGLIGVHRARIFF